MRSAVCAALVCLFLTVPAVGQEAPPIRAPEAADLPLMVLPRGEVGAGAGFVLDDDFPGAISNAVVAPGLGTSAEELARLGRVDGYSLRFRRGVARLGTTAELMSSPEAAAAYVELLVPTFSQTGLLRTGERIAGLRRFAVNGIGDAAAGLSVAFSAAGRFGQRSTTIVFRVGNLVGTAQVFRPQRAVATAETTALAVSLAERFTAVLDGTATGPRPPRAPERARQPAGELRLAAIALAPAQVARRARVSGQGFVHQAPFLMTYRRNFSPSPTVRVGAARSVFLETSIGIAEDQAGARFGFATERIFAGKLAERFRGLAEEEGFRLRAVRLRATHVRLPADEAIAHRLTFVDPAGDRFANVILTLRVGRVVGVIDASDLAGRIAVADLLPLARKQVARMRAEQSRVARRARA